MGSRAILAGFETKYARDYRSAPRFEALASLRGYWGIDHHGLPNSERWDRRAQA
jgi:hypothetical protein